MGVEIKEKSDKGLAEVAEALRHFDQEHPGTHIILYRYNPVSIRIRIVSNKFKGMSKSDRHDYALNYLQGLTEETYADLSLLLCLAPGERSMMDLEFENPSTSMR
jgi:stress-induced morphogen